MKEFYQHLIMISALSYEDFILRRAIFYFLVEIFFFVDIMPSFLPRRKQGILVYFLSVHICEGKNSEFKVACIRNTCWCVIDRVQHTCLYSFFLELIESQKSVCHAIRILLLFLFKLCQKSVWDTCSFTTCFNLLDIYTSLLFYNTNTSH